MLTLATITPGAPEIFAALQGEGASAGKPSVFIRLSRCNLACVWCDTPYTWHFDADPRPHIDNQTYPRAEEQITLPEAQAAAKIHALLPQNPATRRVVITGGEPLLQPQPLAKLIDALQTIAPTHIEIETNGSIPPPEPLLSRVDQWNVSPKLAHSGNPETLAINPQALARYAAHPQAWFKFVIAQPDDVAEVTRLAQAHQLPANRILLMPEGRDSATLRTRARWLADIALEHGYTLTDRLHIHLSGDTRGT